MAPSDFAIMSFGDHLEDLRKRVVFAGLGFIPIFVLGLVFGGPLLEFLTIPLTDALRDAGQPATLLATSPLETFGAYIRVSIIVAVMGAFPWMLYQLWLFVAPGLYTHERRFVYFLIPLSTALTALSAIFLYKVLLPISLYFLIFFGSAIVQQDHGSAAAEPVPALTQVPILEGDPAEPAVGDAWYNAVTRTFCMQVDEETIMRFAGQTGGAIMQQYRIGEYVSLIFWLGLAFAIAFQLPVVMMLLGWVDILRPGDITRFRRYVVFGCAIAGAILTPQDPFSMLILGAALYMLFEFGLILMRFVPASRVAGEIDETEERW